ncbi:MAG: hypothetical protein CMJ31_06105, partial [Phycisphaerae bacterium]|nr:hypothetical protein [Phycisphaerae bacterium]
MAAPIAPDNPRIEPPPAEWPKLIDGAARSSIRPPSTRQTIMSGHQAAIWHPGILAKLIATTAAANAFDADAAWLVVDQDANNAGAIDYPVRENARLQRRSALAAPEQRTPTDTPTGSTPVLRWSSTTESDKANRILARLAETPGDNAADQVTRLLAKLLPERLGITPPQFITATSLAKTPTFDAWRSAMLEDPAACVNAYNAAVATNPEAQLRPLATRPDANRYELPLWRIRPGEPRRPVYNLQLADIPIDELAPRALLMTAIVRASMCDLFIHGTGGYTYDRVTDDWMKTWLGVDLAPIALVTATLHLDLGVPPVTESEVAHAKWRAHAARHDPALLDDAQARSRKIAAVESIASEPNPARRSELFLAMHDDLATVREKHEAELE